MANVQIRDVPPELHRRLKAQAATAGQSLNQYLLDRLSEIAGTITLDELIAAHRELPPHQGPSAAEIAAIIREDRDSR